MAKTVVVALVDDIDGSRADETVAFSFDGLSFEIDLASGNATKMRSIFTAWADAGRPAEETAGHVESAAVTAIRPYVDRVQGNSVRDWARRHGHDVAKRGRLPLRLVDAFEAANSDSRTG
jgi:hypothetical protein